MDYFADTPQTSFSYELRTLINQRNVLTAKSKAKVLHELDKQIEEGKMKREISLRNRVIDEILTSELSYLHQLEIIIKFFKEPLESSNLLGNATKRSLFGNIESIYGVNGELVNQLKMKQNNVGAAFLHLAPFFKLYSMYAYDYKTALAVLEDHRKQDCRLDLWLRSQETRPEVSCRLSALLIVPIQRLPRYRLLLRQLLSLTPSTHPHHTILTEAVREVEKATAHIDGLVSEQETHSRLATLQQCLVNNKPTIIAHDRKLLKEGVLIKMSADGQRAQHRYFVLLSDVLLYCKQVGRWRGEQPTEPGSLRCCCMLPLAKCRVEAVLGQGVFNLSCRGETLIFFSEHRDDALDWVTAIRNAASQYQDNLRTLRKKSSSRYPMHLNKKRKRLRDDEECKENNGSKRLKINHLKEEGNQQQPVSSLGKENVSNIPQVMQTQKMMQSIKSVFQMFGESVRQYLYPGPRFN